MLKKLKDWHRRHAGLMLLEELPQAQCRQIIEDCVADGWEIDRSYEGTDWQSRGKLVLHKGQSTLKFSFASANDGQIEGPARIVLALAKQLGVAPS
ncbi:hypothetical protein P2G88_07685 [Aliiglaciecola sp. CAU 1673]|uniref:hypothetical protein n=1 Tax=Aliiglaciecola sp. CAU 1673 TaxID=3032595 RepID=UPI0023DB6D2C|nr:hypothetical protein [Aliiglaciecola sp. CAU 1673]MDF2178132.1 hypothetical protein [Aliiglaciecola sp. CAU 1673]